MTNIILSQEEIEIITGYKNATKQLGVLKNRGFVRAYISRRGEVILERSHYESVTRCEAHGIQPNGRKVANLSFFNKAVA